MFLSARAVHPLHPRVDADLMSISLVAAQPYPSQHVSKSNITPPTSTSATKRGASHLDMPPERASKKKARTDSTVENAKKQRGRPRVDGEDETAADVSPF